MGLRSGPVCRPQRAGRQRRQSDPRRRSVWPSGLSSRAHPSGGSGRKWSEMPLNADRNRCVSPPTGIPSSRAYAALWAGGCSPPGCSVPCASAIHRCAGFVRGVMWVLSDLRVDIVDAALATYCVDISEPKTLRGLLPAYRLYTARWSLADLTSDRRRPLTTAPDRQPSADPSASVAPRPSSLGPGEGEIPRVPFQYERAVLAGAAAREKLRSTVATRQAPEGARDASPGRPLAIAGRPAEAQAHQGRRSVWLWLRPRPSGYVLAASPSCHPLSRGRTRERMVSKKVEPWTCVTRTSPCHTLLGARTTPDRPRRGAMNRRVTVAELLSKRALPADWRHGPPLGRVDACIYRAPHGREPGHAFRLVNGRFRQVMTYAPASSTCSPGRGRRTAAPPDSTCPRRARPPPPAVPTRSGTAAAMACPGHRHPAPSVTHHATTQPAEGGALSDTLLRSLDLIEPGD